MHFQCIRPTQSVFTHVIPLINIHFMDKKLIIWEVETFSNCLIPKLLLWSTTVHFLQLELLYKYIYGCWDICIKYCLKGTIGWDLFFQFRFSGMTFVAMILMPHFNSLPWTQPSTQSTYAHSQGTYKLGPILVIYFILYKEGYEIIRKFKWL